MANHKDTPLSPRALRVLHVAETTHGGIQAYWNELKSIKEIEQDFLSPEKGSRGLRRSVWLFILLRRKLKLSRYDILHLHSSFSGLIGRLTILTVWKKPKVVYCAHGWAFNMSISNWKKQLYALIERILLQRTDAIVNVSKFEAMSAHKYGIRGKKCHTILNGVQDLPTLPQKSLNDNQLHLLFVGRFHKAKGIDILEKIIHAALKEAPHLHFHIAGGAQATNEIALTFPKNTTFYGWLEQENILLLYAACDALIIPSRWDAFSLVAAEAIRASKPLILNDAAALPEFIENGAQGYILDLTHTGSTIDFLKTLNAQSLRKMGEHNRLIFQKFYTSERMNEELLKLYRALSASA